MHARTRTRRTQTLEMIYRKMSALAERMASEPFDGLTLPLPRLIKLVST
jgi:hypothetical protein